jgi:hypothetical protein
MIPGLRFASSGLRIWYPFMQKRAPGANYLLNSEWRAYFPRVLYSPTPGIESVCALACHPQLVEEHRSRFFQFQVIQTPVRYAATVEGDNAATVIYEGKFPDHSVVAALPDSFFQHGDFPVA